MSDAMISSNNTSKPTIKTKLKSGWLIWLVVIMMLSAGLGIRLYDLTDPPMDFHPTRQLRGAIIARSIYLNILPNADPQDRQLATTYAGLTGRYEPPILETLVAYTYRMMGKEEFWIARIYNAFFWLLGGVCLFLLGRRMTNATAGLIALGYYLFLPFAAQASRSFQPDPGMVMWLVIFSYALYRWGEPHSLKWAIITGIAGGIAIFTKPVAVYIVGAASIVVVVFSFGLWQSLRRLQVWMMAILMALPSFIYYLLLGSGNAADYIANWTVALSHLIIEPAFYVRWLSFVQNWMGFSVILLALIGVIITTPRNKALLCGLWVGYFIYGLTLPYQMYTHNYYHLQLVPILALSLAAVGQVLSEHLRKQSRFWQILFAGVALVGMIFPCWVAIATLKADDYRKEPAYWHGIGELLPVDGKIIALTQDYGYRLMYYGWRKVDLWQTSSEQDLAELRGREKEFSTRFSNKIEGKDYFLVTAMGQWKNQPTLQKTLTNNYPLIAEGDGYLLFDLAHPLTP
ncbi:MAG: glycosyltransferase family 39 protein [Anaerolineales bacterium]|nr:glycosyltransferase family 39 protein [Anaerolineales bacterium]